MSSLHPGSDDARSTDGQSVDAIHDRIRQAILRGEIAPGDELSQVQLARELGVSRTPLREGLRMLVHEGLLEGSSGRQLRVAGFSIKDMEQLYVQRVTLEAIAVRITVPRLTTDSIERMEQCDAEMAGRAAAGDYEEWEVPHRRLHGEFVSAAGDRMTALIRQLSDHAERYRRLYTLQAPGSYAIGRFEHRSIIGACRSGDRDEASRALAEHLGHTALGVIDLVEPDHRASALRLAIAVASLPLDAAANTTLNTSTYET